MKKFIYSSILVFLLMACSKGDEDENNNGVPVILSPANNEVCVNDYVFFEWEKIQDQSNDYFIYQIEIAADNQFKEIIETVETESNSTEISLEKNTTYYWRIKSTNSEGLSSNYSKTYKFYTEGETVYNYLPEAPELKAPEMNTALNPTKTTLKWEATDYDGDNLSYDVYFGTANPPTKKISEKNTTTTLEVTLEPGKEYFWRVVVKDNNGSETIGQVWKFKTN